METKEEYERINELVKKTIEGDEESTLALLKAYEYLIIKIAKKYCLPLCCWDDWVCELKSQFFILVREFNPIKFQGTYTHPIFFSHYITKKLTWYAYYRVVQQDKQNGRQVPLHDPNYSEWRFENEDDRARLSRKLTFEEERVSNSIPYPLEDWETIVTYVKVTFSEVENIIFCLHHHNGCTQEEVGKKVGKSQSTISRILSRIKGCLKEEFGRDK